MTRQERKERNKLFKDLNNFTIEGREKVLQVRSINQDIVFYGINVIISAGLALFGLLSTVCHGIVINNPELGNKTILDFLLLPQSENKAKLIVDTIKSVVLLTGGGLITTNLGITLSHRFNKKKEVSEDAMAFRRVKTLTKE